MTQILEREIIEELVVVLGDDMAAFIGTFINYSAELLRHMCCHAENGDIKNLTMVVHSFKGSSKNIGATELGDLLHDLEVRLRRGDIDGIDPAFPLVHIAYENVCTALQNYLLKCG